MTAIKDLFDGGWLKYGSPRNTPTDRLNIAVRLRNDFDIAGTTAKATDYAKPRVDGGNVTSSYTMEALERFCRAFNSIPPQYRSYVRWICCEDKPFRIKGSRWDVARQKTYLATLLCLGLDELIKYYIKPHRKQKIASN